MLTKPEMLRSKIIKFNIVLALLLLPTIVSGKTLLFGEKKWEIETNSINFLTQAYTRNDFSLVSLINSVVLDKNLEQPGKIFDPATINQIEDLTAQINQSTENAKLILQNGKAEEFNPGQNGQALDIYSLAQSLQSDALLVGLPVLISEPKIKLSQTNTLGINELVAAGESDFSGSPANRVHNISVGSKKYDGVIIKPLEEFSFNKFLGDVDAEHGFLPELVIKPDGLVPEFGGGLCQVSTTAFRAAMNAGLPITARRNHSFAVKYYAPQGSDATIYPGALDLKFTNNLPSSFLIHTKIVGRKLYFEFYGTKDNRSVVFEGPYQFDQKPDGSMKASWTRHVTMNDQTTTQTFKSTYLPPALFQKITVTEPSTPNPETPSSTQ